MTLASRSADRQRVGAALRRARLHGLWIERGAGADLDAARAVADAFESDAVRAVLVVEAAEISGLLAALGARAHPLVLAIRPGTGDASAIAEARDALARTRSPWLRVAWIGWPRCADAPAGDVRLQVAADSLAARPLVAACETCPLLQGCPGPALGLAARPGPRTVSNQVDFVQDGAADAAEALAVPASEAARALIVHDRSAGRFVRYRCDDRSWTDAELAEALDHRGQAWTDRSDKARLTDFAADLAGLQRVEPSRPAPADATYRVPSIWQATDETPFAREEAAMLARMAGLRGTVVDVGAGPLRYLEALGAGIASGRVRYVTVEPDRAALAALRGALPGACLGRGVGEALPLPDASADHVLVLRAWNHLREPDRVLAEAARVLRDDGELLVIDNVAFALLRTREAAERAHAVPVSETPFEHYRNDGAREALVWFEGAREFAVDEVEDVGPGRGNQWLLRARRRPRGG
ncbi:MAG: hypothetical protein RIT45_3709 [Pseudomonadota bacterium]